MSSRPLVISASLALVPPLLLSLALRLHWTGLLWASPLLLLGWSVILLAAFLYACHIADAQSDRRYRYSHESLRSLPRLAFLTPAAWSAQRTRLQWARESHSSASAPSRKRADASALTRVTDEIVELILRDFVCKWHTPLATGSDNPTANDSAPEFVQAVEQTIRNALDKVTATIKRLDHADLVVRRLTPKISAHIRSYRKAEAAFRGPSERAQLASFESDQNDLFLARKFENGRLHPAVGDMSSPNTRPAEQAFLRSVCTRLLRVFMPYPESESPSVQIIVRELLSCTILFAIIESISDPDFWNHLLEQKAGAVIHEQILVSKLRDALDKQETLSSIKTGKSRAVPFIDIEAKNLLPWSQETKKPDQKSFDAFLRSIKHATSLLEVRRTKNDIAVQIRKTKTNLERLSEEPSNSSRAKLQSYLKRLETAYALADQKIAQLGSDKGLPTVSAKVSAGADPNASRVKLHDVLLNPSSLSFFMEFMDRRKRSVLVQFWLFVESFKNPLEDAEPDPSTDREQLRAAASASPPSRAAVQTLKEDLRMFDKVYYSSPAIKVSQRYVESARQFLRVDDEVSITALQVMRVRRDVLHAQKEIYEDMEVEDWPRFRDSELFVKAAQDLGPNAHLAAGLASSVGSLAAEAQPSMGQKAVEVQRPVVRSTKSHLEHSDLFGTDKPVGAEAKQPDLFGDSPSGSRSKASAKSDNLDILIGGRTQHAGPDGRTPLFREDPLFDEQEDDGDEQGDNSSDFIQVEKMDELQSVLQSIIDDDLDKSRKRPGALASSGPTGGKSSARSSDPDVNAGSTDSRKGSGNFSNSDDASRPRTPRETTAISVLDEFGPSNAFAGLPSFNLRNEIQKMDAQLEKLEAQADILEALARKAELTGARSSETRLLAQSIQAVRREARDIRWQRSQLEQQMAETQLIPGQTKISIQDTMISIDHEGKEFAVYLIEVGILEQQNSKSTAPSKGGEVSTSTARGWIVGRRYSEFWALHQALKERFAEVRALESEFPGKRLVGLVHAPFVDARKASLEKYLQALVRVKVACESEELRMFLSQDPTATTSSLGSRASSDAAFPTQPISSGPATPGKQSAAFPGGALVKTLFKGMTGVAEGLDDLIGIGPSMLDVVVQRLSTQMQTKSSASLVQGIADIDMVSQAMDKDATHAELREAAGAGTTYWTEPICDLFTELFELDEKNNWLRRQAIVILLQQLFGSTVERKIRETFSAALSPTSITGYVTAFKASLWPNGVLKEPTPPRTRAEKDLLRENANSKLATLIPELAANFVGRENARKGTRRVFSALQNKRLNKHLIYSLLDVVVDELLAVPSVALAAKG